MDEHEKVCPGLHDPAQPSCFEGTTLPPGGRFVERCDELNPLDCDEEAARAAGLQGAWAECPNGGAHYLVGCTLAEAGLEEWM